MFFLLSFMIWLKRLMFAQSVFENLVGRLEKSCHPWEGNRNIVQQTTTTTFIYAIQVEEKERRKRKQTNGRFIVIYIQVCELVYSSQSSKAFELAAARCMQMHVISPAENTCNFCYFWLFVTYLYIFLNRHELRTYGLIMNMTIKILLLLL